MLTEILAIALPLLAYLFLFLVLAA